ncbi:MAG: hypothetical protein ABJE63_12070 [Lentilitoribacter sp.]
MADFTGVIRRAVEGLATNTPEARQKVYDRARQTIQRQLEAMPNSSSSAIFERQLSSVEDAIKEIEAGYADGNVPQPSVEAKPASLQTPVSTPKPVSTPIPASTPAPASTEAPSTPPQPIEPVAPVVSKPVEPVAPKEQELSEPVKVDTPKEEPAPISPAAPVVATPAKVEPVEVEPKSEDAEISLVEKPVEPMPEPVPKPVSDPEPSKVVAEEVASLSDAASMQEPVVEDVKTPAPEPVETESVAEEPAIEPVQEVLDDVVVPDEDVSVSNDIDEELTIPVVDRGIETASVVDDKVSEIVSDVTSKIDAGQSGKEMPKADSSFLTDDSIIDQAVGEIKSSLQADPADKNSDFPDHDAAFGFGAEALPEAPEPKRKKSPIVMIVAAILLVLAGSAYGLWRYGVGSFSSDGTQVVEVTDAPSEADESASDADAPEEREVVTKVEETTPATSETGPAGDAEKFTQRLNVDGTEEDVGPSPEVINGLPGEEGRSVAELSGDGTATEPAQQTEPVTDGAPTIEKMLFYETSLGLEQQARYEGGVTWSEEVESDGTASRPFIRAQIQVPERNLSIDMSIKLNGDQTLPVSHLVDINFSLPDDFEGGEIDQVTEVKMKNTEEQPGDRLAAISAKIDTTFFVVGLENDDPEVVATNLQLLSRRNWIDIPISYSNGRKALITLEKGASGVAIFDKVLAAWERNPVQ